MIKSARVPTHDVCTLSGNIELLNQECFCLSLDQEALAYALDAELGTGALLTMVQERYPICLPLSPSSYTVDLHPVHLRHIAEKMGLIATSAPQALKTIAALQRRMLALHDRIENLSDWMARYSDHKHADLSHETTQLNAMADLAREWCHDFDEPEQDAYIATPTTNNEKLPKCTPALTDQAELL